MPTRRAILAATLGAALPFPALAATPPGRISLPTLPRLLDTLARIDDGDPAKPRIRVVFSPSCSHSLRLFEASRARRMDASWGWIPFANGIAAQRMACQAALDDGTEAGLAAVLRGAGAAANDRVMAAQDRVVIDRVGRMLWDATNAALGTPSIAYMRADGVAMAVRGSLGPDLVDAMVDAAA